MSNSTIFTPMLLAAFAFFGWSAWRRFSLLSLGRSEERLDNIGVRLKEMLLYAFGQKRVLAKPVGLNHFIIFWSFMFLLIANGEFMLHGVFPTISLTLLPDAIYFPLVLILDIVSLLALCAVIFAAVRRMFFPPYPEARTPEGFFILLLIALLMLAYFGINASKLVRLPENFIAVAHTYMPISSMFAALINPAAAKQVHDISWWTHAVALLAFICYLPHSKHMHIMTAIPNCFLRRLEKPNTLPREEFVTGNTYGVDRVERFSWKDLLDSFSCTECGRCQMACPASITGKPLNPRGVIHDIKVNLLQNGPLLKQGVTPAFPLIGPDGEGSVSEEAIWSCTTCGACMEACPVFIEQMPKLLLMRRHLVEEEAKFPEELLNLFENMEGRSNPWGIAPSDRTKWCAQLDIKSFDKDTTEYLFYVGCAGSFDSRNKLVTVAMAQLLDHAGVSWGILGKEEKCCGDSLRRLGNELVFDRMARENVQLFREKGVKKIITQCPHCFTTLKNDYRQYGLELEVYHHSEIINRLMVAGKLKLNREVHNLGQILFHDSCYLGRHNDVYDAPRGAIQAATGNAPLEMERNRNNSFCCGAGGGRMWMEEVIGTRINLNRVEEALRAKPDTICTSCPYCMTMFEDGLKDLQAGTTRVKDIAEVVAEGLLPPEFCSIQ